MTSLTKRLLAAAAILAALGTPALVGALSQPALAQDAKIDSGRLGDAVERLFRELDANKDGTVDKGELDAVHGIGGDSVARSENTRGGWLARRDADSDGSISKSEFLSNPEKRFGELDKNSDGKLDTAELDAAREARRERWQEIRAERGPGGRWQDRGRFHDGPGFDGPRGKWHGRGPNMSPDERAGRIFNRFDVNKDGTITRDEVEAGLEKWHDRRGRDRG